MTPLGLYTEALVRTRLPLLMRTQKDSQLPETFPARSLLREQRPKLRI